LIHISHALFAVAILINLVNECEEKYCRDAVGQVKRYFDDLRVIKLNGIYYLPTT
jgi:hypothetical protein